jgi:hypothetical protein
MSAMTETEINLARRFRAGGMTWKDLGRCFNVTPETVKYQIDPEWKNRSLERRAELRQAPRIPSPQPEDASPTRAELAKLLRSIPLDTRDLTARICGDPLPGRSALDMRGQA